MTSNVGRNLLVADMTQKSRPDDDISVENWTTEPLFSKINEAEPNDSTFISSPDDPELESFEVELADLAWPESGPQTVTTRIRRNGADNGEVAIVELLQGSDAIASRQVKNLTESFQDYTLTLTDEEKGRITSYLDLTLKVTATLPVSCSACDLETTPLQFDVTVSGVATGSCGSCDSWNKTFRLTQTSGCRWYRDGGPCGDDPAIDLHINLAYGQLLYALRVMENQSSGPVIHAAYVLHASPGDTDCSLDRTLPYSGGNASQCDYSLGSVEVQAV